MNLNNAVPQRVLLFDLKNTGHHAGYIRHLIQYWGKNELKGELFVLVSPPFKKSNQHIIDTVNSFKSAKIKICEITSCDLRKLDVKKSTLGRVVRNIREWLILCKYIKQFNIDHCFIMYLDTCELPIFLGLNLPCKFSGIYFRPTFHYNQFDHYLPSKKDHVQHWRDKIFLNRILENPRFSHLFCLDPFAVNEIKKKYPEAKVTHLADPVSYSVVDKKEVSILRENLEIQSDRKIFFLFGSIDGRKGIYKVLKALSNLDDALCSRICFLIVGNASHNDRLRIEDEINLVCEKKPVQIITRFEFINEKEISVYFDLADYVLALYQKHAGMSGILLLAAAAKKPVFSSNYGLMGEIVRHYEIGLSVDSISPKSIEEGFVKILNSSVSQICNTEKMELLIQVNSINRFSETVFSIF